MAKIPILSVYDENGNKIEIPAIRGANGVTPHVGANGNWFLGETDTGVKARCSESDITSESIKNALGYTPADNETVEQLSETIADQNEVISGIQAGTYIDYDANVKAVNHRGYSTTAPENTIPAYIMSKQKGFKYVECDVAFTSDNVAVLLHDTTIDRTSDGSGSISSLTYADVLQYDFGSWKSAEYTGTKIPTFEEFIMLCKAIALHPYIELKSSGAYTEEQIAGIVSAVKAHGMEGKVTYISFYAPFLTCVKNADSKARLGYLADVTTSTITTALGLKTEDNEVFMDVSYNNVTEEKVNLCIENDLPLEIWTVNSESVVQNMDAYITGVTSDNLIAGKILYNKYMEYVAPEEPDTPTKVLTSISATYSGGDVAVGTDLTNLTGIMVTATYSDGSTAIVTGYTLSGAIVEGSNIITVSYGGKTSTFTVTGVTETGGEEPDTPNENSAYESWDFTKSATSNLGTVATLGNYSTIDSDGLHLTQDSKSYALLSEFTSDITALEVDVSEIGTGGSTANNRFICTYSAGEALGNLNPSTGFIYRNTGKWNLYGTTSKEKYTTMGWGIDSDISSMSAFENCTIRLEFTDNGTKVYKDGELVWETDRYIGYWGRYFCLGADSTAIKGTTVTGFRTYK